MFVNALRINDWKYCNLKLFEISVFRGRPFKSLYNHVPSAGCISYFFPPNCIPLSQIILLSLIKRV